MSQSSAPLSLMESIKKWLVLILPPFISALFFGNLNQKKQLSSAAPTFGASQTAMLLIINQLSAKKPTVVLDYAAGSELLYYGLFPFLNHPERVFWHVVGSEELLAAGKSQQKPHHLISFSKRLPPAGSNFDILHISSPLGGAEDYKSQFQKLLGYGSTWVHFSQFVESGEITFIHVKNFLDSQSFDLMVKAPGESGSVDSLICTFTKRAPQMVARPQPNRNQRTRR